MVAPSRLSAIIPANPAATGIHIPARGINAAYGRDGCNHCSGQQPGQRSGNRDASIGPSRDTFPGGDQPSITATGLPNFARHGVGGRFRQSSHGGHNPRPISRCAASDRAQTGHGQIRQDLPCVPAFPAFGQTQFLLAAISEASGKPGHQEQRGQGGKRPPDRRQQTARNRLLRRRPLPIDSRPARRAPARRSPGLAPQQPPAVPGSRPTYGSGKKSTF